MEKINIAELLKDCPRGMELYSPIFGKVYLDKVRRYLAIIVTTDRKQGDSKEEFLYDGRYGMNGECMLFPSKGKTTWEGFVPPCKFKNGDILYIATNDGKYNLCMVDCIIGGILYTKTSCSCNGYFLCTCEEQVNIEELVVMRFATEEEKAKLFQEIKDNGYKWNEETKTLEKLPKFKVGDKVRHKDNNTIITITGIKGDYYFIQFYNPRKNDYQTERFSFKDQDKYELVPNKFDINTLKPFKSKVLTRTENSDIWEGDIFVRYDRNATVNKFHCIGGWYEKCIPFRGNEWLLGTTDDCKEYYKTWKK